jgi:hypothetical protein
MVYDVYHILLVVAVILAGIIAGTLIWFGVLLLLDLVLVRAWRLVRRK